MIHPSTTAISSWGKRRTQLQTFLNHLSVDTCFPEGADNSSRVVIDKLDSRVGILFCKHLYMRVWYFHGHVCSVFELLECKQNTILLRGNILSLKCIQRSLNLSTLNFSYPPVHHGDVHEARCRVQYSETAKALSESSQRPQRFSGSCSSREASHRVLQCTLRPRPPR